MRIRLRPLHFLVKHSVVAEDGGVRYNTPVNWFEHVARCTDWRGIADRKGQERIFIRVSDVTSYIASAIIDHYLLAKRVVIESLDPEFCVPYTEWKGRVRVEIYRSFDLLSMLKADRNVGWFPRDGITSREPVSVLRSMAKSTLTGKQETVPGRAHLIVGDDIAVQMREGFGEVNRFRVWSDSFVPRSDQWGQASERAFRERERTSPPPVAGERAEGGV